MKFFGGSVGGTFWRPNIVDILRRHCYLFPMSMLRENPVQAAQLLYVIQQSRKGCAFIENPCPLGWCQEGIGVLVLNHCKDDASYHDLILTTE
jgi:hypothetical protein